MMTFQERGVYVPMTSPALAGARVRSITRLELAPAGGAWVLPADVPDLTVYDRSLLLRLGSLPAITPALVRDSALMVMAEGLAGRRAKIAAVAATARDEAARMHAHDYLLASVIRRFEPGAALVRPGDKASLAMDQLARLTGCSSAALAAGLATMAADLAAIGLGLQVGAARIPALLADIHALRQTIASLPTTTRQHGVSIELIAAAADGVLAALTSVLTPLRTLAGDPVMLAKTWTQDAASIQRLSARVGWLADGWPWLLGSWPSTGDNPAKRRALAVMVLRLPTLSGSLPRADVGAVDASGCLPGRYDARGLTNTIVSNEDLLARAA